MWMNNPAIKGTRLHYGPIFWLSYYNLFFENIYIWFTRIAWWFFYFEQLIRRIKQGNIKLSCNSSYPFAMGIITARMHEILIEPFDFSAS